MRRHRAAVFAVHRPPAVDDLGVRHDDTLFGEHGPNVGRSALFVAAQALVLEDVQADPGHPGPRRRSDAFVEVAEPRPAEVRPDEIGKAQLAGVAHVGQRGR